LFACLIILLIACTVYAQNKKVRVLFIGNSYTGTNDLPQIVANMAASTRDTLVYGMSAPGGTSFFNHVDPSSTSYIHTLKMLRAGGWDYVVVQEQSVSPAMPPDHFYRWSAPYAKQLVDSVKLYNPCAEIIFYMTWGRKNGLPDNCAGYPTWPYLCTYHSMDSVIRARYMEMTDSNKATVSPVGAVWRYIRSHYPSIELYDADESHPAPAGSYAGACSFYTAIFKKPAALITYNFSLSSTDAANIRTAASRVVYDSLNFWHIGQYETIASFSHNTNDMLPVSFTNKSINATQYKWSFGDGQTSTEASPTHTYTSPRFYTVRLVSIGVSCTDTAYARIKITDDPGAAMFIVAPNPATDMLYIQSDVFTTGSYRIQMLNIMGQLVYEQRASSAETQFINVSGLTSGGYILNICTTRRVYHKKIIIQK
jgi:hypothetical protein